LIGDWLRGERAESPILNKRPRFAEVPGIQRLIKIVIKGRDFLILYIDAFRAGLPPILSPRNQDRF
jgi:hypothetical protein